MPAEAGRHGQLGFTWTELLVTLALLGLLAAGLAPVLWIGVEGYDEARRREAMYRQARLALDRLLRDLQASHRVQTGGEDALEMDVQSTSGQVLRVRWERDASDGLLYRRSFPVEGVFSWRYSRQLTVQTGSSAVPKGYSVSFLLDHRALVAAGKSLTSGDDVRVFYLSPSGVWVELPRLLDPLSAWGTTGTRLWFKLQERLPANSSTDRYQVVYGNLNAAPPADEETRGGAVFLDYENGRDIAEWTPRLGSSGGTYQATPTEGVRFFASSGSGLRELTRRIADPTSSDPSREHRDVEVFWIFRSAAGSSSDTANRHLMGASLRRSDLGAGYLATPFEGVRGAWRLRVRRTTGWGDVGRTLTTGSFSYTPTSTYAARFDAVGGRLRLKVWSLGDTEPGGFAAWPWWTGTGCTVLSPPPPGVLCVEDSIYASGRHYGLVNGLSATATLPIDQRHVVAFVRLKVEPEPSVTVGPEATNPLTEAPRSPVAGPYRRFESRCYANAREVPCGASAQLVAVRLQARDPEGATPDVALEGQARLRVQR